MTDAGPGIAAEDREHAFDQFFRGEQARRMVPDGSGIGLYAARGLVEAMQGRLTVNGAPGEGATFLVTLPAEPTEPEVETPGLTSGTEVSPACAVGAGLVPSGVDARRRAARHW